MPHRVLGHFQVLEGCEEFCCQRSCWGCMQNGTWWTALAGCRPLHYLNCTVSQNHGSSPWGHWFEFGVYYGATLQSTALHLLRATATGTSGTPGTHHPRVVGFDSFQGISEAWREFPEFTFSTEGEVPINLPPNAKVVVGWYNETLPRFLSTFSAKRDFIEWVHLDCDTFLGLLCSALAKGHKRLLGKSLADRLGERIEAQQRSRPVRVVAAPSMAFLLEAFFGPCRPEAACSNCKEQEAELLTSALIERLERANSSVESHPGQLGNQAQVRKGSMGALSGLRTLQVPPEFEGAQKRVLQGANGDLSDQKEQQRCLQVCVRAFTKALLQGVNVCVLLDDHRTRLAEARLDSDLTHLVLHVPHTQHPVALRCIEGVSCPTSTWPTVSYSEDWQYLTFVFDNTRVREYFEMCLKVLILAKGRMRDEAVAAAVAQMNAAELVQEMDEGTCRALQKALGRRLGDVPAARGWFGFCGGGAKMEGSSSKMEAMQERMDALLASHAQVKQSLQEAEEKVREMEAEKRKLENELKSLDLLLCKLTCATEQDEPPVESSPSPKAKAKAKGKSKTKPKDASVRASECARVRSTGPQAAEYTVTLDQTSGKRMGVDLLPGGKRLIIGDINDASGLIEERRRVRLATGIKETEWNRTAPKEKRVKNFHLITEVNGVGGDAQEMLRESKEQLSFKFGQESPAMKLLR
eukprot:g33198.t1